MSASSGLPPVTHCLISEFGHPCFNPNIERTSIFILAAVHGFTESHRCAARRWGALTLAQDSPSSFDVYWHDGSVCSLGNERGASPKGLTPSVGAPAALGEDHERPAFVDQIAGQVGRRSADLGPVDGDRPDDQRRQGSGHAGTEEVVGGSADYCTVTPWCRQGTQEERRVDMAVVVGGKYRRTCEVVEPIFASAGRLSETGHDWANQAIDQQRAGSSGRFGSGPIGGEVGPRDAAPLWQLHRLWNRWWGKGEWQRLEWFAQSANEGNLRSSESSYDLGSGERCSAHFTSAMSIGGLWKCVIVG